MLVEQGIFNLKCTCLYIFQESTETEGEEAEEIAYSKGMSLSAESVTHTLKKNATWPYFKELSCKTRPRRGQAKFEITIALQTRVEAFSLAVLVLAAHKVSISLRRPGHGPLQLTTILPTDNRVISRMPMDSR